ncbi:hypothetical protein VT52_012560 [Streptomyces malaysiense]|uniref:Uncharacterized protein n=1 Tax=Streptomyces malaysiense TaxID=1428626 RepID=A0A1J4Q2K6_9ACTN|nr:hypothetical protein VT52_012560 [Streptomyces malaysiense]
MGQVGDVAAGVHLDQDVRITRSPAARARRPLDDIAKSGGGGGGRVVGRAQAEGVQESAQEVRPDSRAATKE